MRSALLLLETAGGAMGAAEAHVGLKGREKIVRDELGKAEKYHEKTRKELAYLLLNLNGLPRD